jgi:hypothetical protein
MIFFNILHNNPKFCYQIVTTTTVYIPPFSNHCSALIEPNIIVVGDDSKSKKLGVKFKFSHLPGLILMDGCISLSKLFSTLSGSWSVRLLDWMLIL